MGTYHAYNTNCESILISYHFYVIIEFLFDVKCIEKSLMCSLSVYFNLQQALTKSILPWIAKLNVMET